MSVPWKEIGSRAKPSNWTPMAWAVLALVVLCTAGSVVVGVKLYQITGQQVEFNPK